MDEPFQTLGQPTPFMNAGVPPAVQPMSIDDDTQEAPAFSVDDGLTTPAVPQLPENVVQSRAAKADLGLSGKTDVTQDTFASSIKDGKEPEARADASNQVTQSRIQFAQDMIRQGKVNDIEAITNLVKPVDPDMVVETHYADAYLNHLDWPKQEDKIDSWVTNDTGVLDAFKLKGTGLASRFEYLRTLKQNADGEQAERPFWDTLDSQGNTVPGRSDEIIKDFMTFGAYGEVQKRGNVEGTGFFSGLGLGTNLDAQAIKLFDIQSDEDFKSQIDKIYNSMPIGLRSEFLSAMIGMSNSEVFLNNFMTAANVAPFASDAKGIAKLAFSAAKNPTLAIQSAKTAVIDMVKQAPRIEVPPQVAAPAVAGNLPESSVRKVVIDKINELSGKNDPVQDLKDRLFEYSRVDREQVLANPGTLGREGANRILDVYDSSDANFASTVLADPTKGGAQRVNVAPTVEVEDRVKKIQAGLADLHRGPDNQVLQVSKPIYIPGLNVHVHNVALGTADGELFSSAEEAQVVAEHYMGLPVKGTLIRTPENDKIWAEYGHYIKVAEEQGRPDAAELLRERMYSMVTRHEEGVTIEHKESNTTRLYRGETKGGKRFHQGTADELSWWTTDKKQAANFGDVKYIDVTKDELRHFISDAANPSADLMTDNPMFRARAKEYNPNATVEQQGTGYYINKVVPLPLDKNFVTDGLITTKFETSDPRDLPLYDIKAYRKDMKEGNVSTGVPPGWASGLANAILGRARTPAERLSQAENLNRLTAKHGPSILLGMLQDGSGPIVKIPAFEWKDFDRLTRYAMKAHNEGTKIPGIWFNNPDEIEKWYLQNLNKTAPDYMINAYFSFKKIMLDDLSMRSISVLGKKNRIGAMQHAISFNNKDGERVTTNFFEGVRIQELPRDHLNILIARENAQDSKVMRSDRINPKVRAELEEDVRNGRAKVVQILDPKTRPLGDIASKRVEYVVSYNHEEKPLSFAPLNRMGGGHFIPEYDWYIKQPSTEIDGDVTHYNGMKTLMSMQTKAQGEEALPHLEAVRQLFAKHSSRTKGLEEDAINRFENEGGAIPHDYLEDAAEANRKTGIPFHKHMEWYFGNEDHGPYLNLHEPLVVLPKNRDLLDMPAGQSLINKYHKPSEGKIFMDGTKDGSLMAKMMTEFTGERDSEELYTMVNKGTKQDPIFSYEPAPYVDPITSMERAFSRMSKSMYNDEMKAFSASHWVKQAEPYLTHSPEQLMAAPLHYIHHPEYKSGVEKEVISQLESNRKQAIDFLGRPSDMDAMMYSKLNKIADSIYNKASSIENKTIREGLKKVVVVPLWMAPKLRDPIGVIRSYAYHGFFIINPSAFFTQFANFANIAALAPRHAATAGMATNLYAVSRLNRTPEVMAKLDKMAVEFTLTGRLGITSRWKPGQWTEAMTILEGSGWDHVGNTNSFKDSVPTNRIVSTKLGSFLEWAQMPMQAGAKTTRVGGWFAAYLEWAERNPGKSIDRAGIDQIKRRASTLDTNMSSAMSSNLHTGLMSIPMQFQAYSLRMMEQYFGKDLTRQEKAQLFAMTTLMWGLKGGALTGIGVGSSFLMQWAYENGYAEGKNTWVDFALNGLPSLIGALITGGGDPHKGTWYNFSKLGNANGIDPLEKIFQSDNAHGTVLGLLGGPSGSMLSDLWNRSYGFRMAMTDPRFHATPADYLAVLRTFTFMSKGWQAWMAQKTGAWYTKNENLVASDITSSQEIMALLVGVQPTRWGDAFYKQKSIADEERHVRETIRQFGVEMARAAIADKDKDPGSRDVHQKNARVLFESIPPEKQGGAFTQALRNYGEDLIYRMDWKFMETFKDTKQMQKIQEVEQGKKR